MRLNLKFYQNIRTKYKYGPIPKLDVQYDYYWFIFNSIKDGTFFNKERTAKDIPAVFLICAEEEIIALLLCNERKYDFGCH